MRTGQMWARAIIIVPYIIVYAQSGLSQLLLLLRTASSHHPSESHFHIHIYLPFNDTFQWTELLNAVVLRGPSSNLAWLLFCWGPGKWNHRRLNGLHQVTQKEWKNLKGCLILHYALQSNIFSPLWSMATLVWFLFLVKGCYSEHQWESISFSAWLILIPRLTCFTFILRLPLSFTSHWSLQSLLCPICLPHPPCSLFPSCAFTSLPQTVPPSSDSTGHFCWTLV